MPHQHSQTVMIQTLVLSLVQLLYARRINGFWILGARSICVHIERFTILEPTSGGLVYMDNNNTCGTEGIGTIQLRLHDGTVKDLKEVRFIPKMKTNLISLGTLEASGYTITLKDDGLKVSLKNMVVMKGIRRKNLYFL